jgi:hypothetical protein
MGDRVFSRVRRRDDANQRGIPVSVCAIGIESHFFHEMFHNIREIRGCSEVDGIDTRWQGMSSTLIDQTPCHKAMSILECKE